MQGLDPGINAQKYSELQRYDGEQTQNEEQTQEEYQLMVLKHNRDRMQNTMNNGDGLEDHRYSQYLYEVEVEIE